MPDDRQFPRGGGPASGQKWKNTIRGNPGDVWTNGTAKVLYQWHCVFANSCGRCIEMANAIGPWWPLPLHHGCTCKNVPIKPGTSAAAFLDYREEVRKLDRAQQRRVIGRANWRLVEAGKVEWADVVQRGRIKTLEEVVSERRLTVRDLRDVGVPEGVAQRAWDRVNTPEHRLIDARRTELVETLKAQGLTAEEIRRRAAGALAGRVGIGGGPSGPQTPPPPPAPIVPPTPPGLPPRPVGSLASFVVPASPTAARIDWKAKGWKDAIEEVGRRKGQEIRKRVIDLGEGAEPARVAEAIGPPGPTLAIRRDDQVAGALMRGKRMRRPTKELEAEIAKAEAFVSRVATGEGRSTPLGYGAVGLSGTAASTRSFHRGTDQFGAVALGMQAQAATVVHELGHAMERQTPGLTAAATAYREYRLAGEKLVSLKRKFPGGDFRAGEMGAKDEFDRVWPEDAAYYLGKSNRSGATEIISMGLEQLYRDAARLARLDPEFFDFLIGALHGHW